jgi:hypothetical protein
MLLLPWLAATVSAAEVQSGFVLGYGTSLRPDTSQTSWSAVGGMSMAFFDGPFYGTASVDLLVVKLPPGSAFFPEVIAGPGLAPWGRWGPHAAVLLGAGARFTGVMAEVGAQLGLGLGPVQIDLQHRRGWQSYEPDLFRANTLQVSLQFDLDVT